MWKTYKMYMQNPRLRFVSTGPLGPCHYDRVFQIVIIIIIIITTNCKIFHASTLAYWAVNRIKIYY